MKPKDYDKLIDLIVRFSNERNARLRHRLLVRIGKEAFMQRFFVLNGVLEDADNDVAAGYQDALVKHLTDPAEGLSFSAKFSGRVYCGAEVGSTPFMDFSSKDQPLVSLFAMLLFVEGFKGIRRCPGCAKFFVIKKHATQKSCSDKCRQRMFQAKLSDKEKKKQRERRSDLYKARKDKGGKK